MFDLWKIEYWIDSSCRKPVEKWLAGLTQEQLRSVAKELKMLERCGNQLKLPHSKALGSGLFELRERRFGYRLYYCFENKKTILLLVAGNKSTQANDIKIARERLLKITKN